MAYPIFKHNPESGYVPYPDGNSMAYFLKLYPRKTKGKRDKSLKSRSKRRK